MAASAECIAAVRAASGDSLDDNQARKLIERMVDQAKLLELQGGGHDLNARLMEGVTRKAEQLEIAAALAKKHAVINATKRAERLAQGESHVAHGLSYKTAALALDRGTMANVPGARVSTDSFKLGYWRGWMGQYTGDMERSVPGWTRLRTNEAFQDDVVRELTELTRTENRGVPGLTKNKEALAAARVMKDIADATRTTENQLGAWIGEHDGWGGPHRHDGDAVRVAGEDVWVQRVKDNFDLTKSFPFAVSEAEQNRILHEMWENIALGRVPEERPDTSGLNMPSSIAEQASQSRVLIAKDADHWLAYNKEFGTGHIFDAMNDHIRRSAQRAGLMEMWGTNYRANREHVLARLEAQ